jgi:hypothetical protein
MNSKIAVDIAPGERHSSRRTGWFASGPVDRPSWGILEPLQYQEIADDRTLELRAIDRWENEGGEIPMIRWQPNNVCP